MKAVLKTKERPGNVGLFDMAELVSQANEIKVKVSAAGFCGTDIKFLHNETWRLGYSGNDPGRMRSLLFLQRLQPPYVL